MTVENIAKLLMQQEELERAMQEMNEREPVPERRNSGSFPNVMREAFEAAMRSRRRGGRYDRA